MVAAAASMAWVQILPKGVLADAESKIPSFDGDDDDDALIALPIFIEVLYLFSG